jgi:hypothetical protein
VIILLYVDDSVMIGAREDLDAVIVEIQPSGLHLQVEGGLNDFLGCSILRDKHSNECWLLQPHLIKKLCHTFGECLRHHHVYGTPGSPRKIIQKTTEEDTALVGEGQTEYWSGGGSLLYLLKHSQPELSNPIRELSKAMNAPNTDHLKEMYRVIKWVLQTPNIGLKMSLKVVKNDFWGI